MTMEQHEKIKGYHTQGLTALTRAIAKPGGF
jgi:hypothetical protein